MLDPEPERRGLRYKGMRQGCEAGDFSQSGTDAGATGARHSGALRSQAIGLPTQWWRSIIADWRQVEAGRMPEKRDVEEKGKERRMRGGT